MAISPLATYTNVDNPGATYPYGRAKNESSPGALDGSPFEKAWLNDLWGFYQRILSKAGIAPSASPETALFGGSQYLMGLSEMLLKKRYSHQDDAGDPSSANIYHLTGLGSTPEISQYPYELEINFICPVTNTGASTASIDGLNDDAIVLPDGTALSGGEMVANYPIKLVRDQANTRWFLQPSNVGQNFSNVIPLTSASVTLLARNVGALHTLSASAAAITMCAIAGMNIGEAMILDNQLATAVSVTADGSSTFSGVVGSTTTFNIAPYGRSIIAKATATSYAVMGDINTPSSAAASGYFYLPKTLGGFLVQWGITGSIASDASATVTYPIPFPTACYVVIPTATNSTSVIDNTAALVGNPGTSTCVISRVGGSWGTTESNTLRWIAIGK